PCGGVAEKAMQTACSAASWQQRISMGKPWSAKEIELAKRLFDQERSEAEIAAKVGRSRKAVRSLLHRQHRAEKVQRWRKKKGSRDSAYGEILRMEKSGVPRGTILDLADEPGVSRST